MTEQAVWTVNKILQWTQQYFSEKGLENPRLDAEVLLCDVLDCRRVDLFMRLQQELQPEELKRYREGILRRAAWEPLAYIVGRKPFLQWEFKVSPAVLIPRPETELLVEKLVHCCTGKSLTQLDREAFWRKKAEEAKFTVEKIKAVSAAELQEETDPEKLVAWQREVAEREAIAAQAAERAGTIVEEGTEQLRLAFLDIGTGSGAILLSLLKLLPDSKGLAVDISAEALAVARENAALLGIEGRVCFLESDIWSRVPEGVQFDIIVSNPPYIPGQLIGTLARDVQKEPRLALDGGPDGLDAYRKIAAGLPRHIKPDGMAAFEVGIGQGRTVAALCGEQGFTVTAVVNDYAGIDRMVFAARPDSKKAAWIKQLQ